MSNYTKEQLARRERPVFHRTLAPAGEQVIAETACPSGGKYYLLSCERDCGATICCRCGKPARATALFNADLVEKFGWATRIEEMGAAEIGRFAALFNEPCKNDHFPAGSNHFPADFAPVGAKAGEVVLRPWEHGSSARGSKGRKPKTAPVGANGGAQ